MRITLRKARNGSLHFVDCDNGGVAMVLSVQQIKILETLQTEGGQVSNRMLHAALYGASRQPLTGSQRASLSRSLRRLRENGLIQQSSRGDGWLVPHVTLADRDFVTWVLER